MEDRLDVIEHKVDTIITILEGKHGFEGLAKQVITNRDDIRHIKSKINYLIGVLACAVPIVTITLKGLIT
jgi:hypothetical protein